MTLTKMNPLQQRLIVSSIGIALMLIIIWLSAAPVFKPVFAIAIAAIIGTAMWEFYEIARQKGLETVKPVGIAFATLYVFAVVLNTQYPEAKELPDIVLLSALIGCFLYFFIKGSSPIINLSATFFGIAYLAVPLSCMLRVAYFFSQSGTQDGRWWLFYLIAVTKITDTGAFFFGKQFGRNKLTPYISPKKTWEGALGGLLAAIAGSALIKVTADWIGSGAFVMSFGQSLFLGLAIGLLAQCGDLAESLLKRDGGVQDSNRLPGLGGMLDIVDSVVFTAPLVYIFLKVYAPQ